MGLLDGKVAVVTGAGGGLGRAFARALGAAGAAVLVNDLGTHLEGGGHDQSRADAVVREIVEAGGRAVADDSDVGSFAAGRAVVERALAEFGRVDAVVHSAGITRSAPLPDLTEEILDAHLAVHLHGAIGVVQGAFGCMAYGGSVVLITSGAGLDPHWPDTAAYACAKAAVYALMRVAAVEGAARSIRVNAIAPFALTRMSASMLAGSPAAAKLDPDRVAPAIVYLASDLSRDVTGRVIRVEGRRIGEYRLAKAPLTDGDWTPETIAATLPAMLSDD
jgi:NAD(P)-dependent dehydrogenase (short-subunit alcohol dehydrogenase family)